MSAEGNEKMLNNEEVVNDITKELQSELKVNCEEANAGTSKDNTSVENSEIPQDIDESNTESSEQKLDDWVDEEAQKNVEITLTEEEKEIRYKQSLELKKRGNDEFKKEQYLESIVTYTEALQLCPLKYDADRSILYANRAAAKVKLGRKQIAIEDCSKAIELNDKYVKAYLRRAQLYEETEKFDESLEDFKKILTIDPGNKFALQAQYRLPPLINERNEKLKTEMLGKLKDLGNVILKPFGLSTDNFQLKQDSNTGGYSVNFVQNSGK